MTIGSNEWEGLSLAGGRYLITAKLGEGGMGFVYRALDQNIKSEVVIKVPRQAMMDDPEFAGRFTREIHSLVKLSHPHIVKVTDVGTWEGTPFAVMQYFPGGSLEDQRPAGPDGQVLPCDHTKVSRWLVAVAEALDYIHDQGYVHRDVKPGNILFDALGHAFLSDFGVAKVLASSKSALPSQTAMTGAGMVLGTPEYMAPELIMGEPFDGRADQYALAITVYEMLCGRRPFEDGTKTKVLVLHTSKAPPRLTDWCPTLPDRLSQTVLKGLNKDPNERYARCAQLAKAVAAAAEEGFTRDDRIRLKCPGCGKTGSMAAIDFARLKGSGKPATCPACKTPIDISSADRVAPGAGLGGTMQFSFSGKSPGYNPPSEQRSAPGGTTTFSALPESGGHTSPRAPQSVHGGTMALSASGTHREQTAPSPSNSPVARRGSGTVIERAVPQSDGTAGTAVFLTLASSESDRPKTLKESIANGKRAPIPARIQIAIGAGAAALLVVVAFVVFQFMPRNETKSTAADPAAKAAIIASPSESPVRPEGQPSRPTPPEPSPSNTPLTKSTDLARATGLVPKMGDRPKTLESPPANALATSGAKPARTKNNESENDTHTAPLAKNRNTTLNSKKVEPAVTVFADGKFDLALLQRKPISPEVTLERILSSPRSHSNQIVIPTGMYNLAPSRADRPGGLRKWLATERKIAPKKDGGALELNVSHSKDLELEPKLAARLDDLEASKWKDKMAILTLWITRDGACGLVKAEILEKATPIIRKVGYTHKGFIEYKTLMVTPEGTKDAIGDRELWEKVGRMNWFANHYRNQVKAYNRMLLDNEQNRLSAQMNVMFGQMMRSAAAQELQQRQLQQRLTGPGR